MPFIPTDSFSRSKRPTAIDPSTYRSSAGYGRVKVIWLGVKKGVTVVTFGEVLLTWKFWMNRHHPELMEQKLTLDEVLALGACDIRYFAEATWNGEELWAKGKMSIDEQVGIAEMLSPVWERPTDPELPAGWLGWFTLTDPMLPDDHPDNEPVQP